MDQNDADEPPTGRVFDNVHVQGSERVVLGNVFPEKKTDSDNESSFSQREEDIIKIAIARCLKSGPLQIDVEELARYVGYSSAEIAATAWSSIQEKLDRFEFEGKSEG
jgi:hypothetical protein